MSDTPAGSTIASTGLGRLTTTSKASTALRTFSARGQRHPVSRDLPLLDTNPRSATQAREHHHDQDPIGGPAPLRCGRQSVGSRRIGDNPHGSARRPLQAIASPPRVPCGLGGSTALTAPLVAAADSPVPRTRAAVGAVPTHASRRLADRAAAMRRTVAARCRRQSVGSHDGASPTGSASAALRRRQITPPRSHARRGVGGDVASLAGSVRCWPAPRRGSTHSRDLDQRPGRVTRANPADGLPDFGRHGPPSDPGLSRGRGAG